MTYLARLSQNKRHKRHKRLGGSRLDNDIAWHNGSTLKRLWHRRSDLDSNLDRRVL